MRFLITSILLISVFYSVFGQKEVVVLDHEFKQPFEQTKQSYSISDEDTNELWTIIEHKNKINIFKFDASFNSLKKLTTKFGKGIELLQGYHITNDFLYIYFSNPDLSKLGLLKIDKSSYQIKQEIINFKIKKEKIVQSSAQNNKFYIITVEKNSSNVTLHEFTDTLKYSSHKLIFPEIGKKREGNKTITVSKLLLGGRFKWISDKMAPDFGQKKDKDKKPIQKIKTENPNTLRILSESSKLYSEGDKMIFTFDNDPEYTQIISIHLDDFELNSKQIKKPQLIEKIKRHNSSLFNNTILQITANENQMLIEIKDIQSGKSIKQFEIKEKDSIAFKNSPIIIDGGLGKFSKNNHREVESTSKFLNKISAHDIGIGLYKFSNGNYQLISGAFKEVVHKANFSIPLAGIPLFMLTISGGFGVSLTAYDEAKYSKSTYMLSYLDADFNHLKSDIPEDAFSLIKDYEDKLEGTIRKDNNKFYFGEQTETALKNIFIHNGKFHFGFIDVRNKNYHIVEFTE